MTIEITPTTAASPDSRSPRRLHLVLSATAAGLAAVATVLCLVHLSIRPPCPDGAIRFLDLARVAPFATTALGLLSGSLGRGWRRDGRCDTGRIIGSAVLLIVTAGAVLGAILAIASDGVPVANDCWSF